MSVKDKLKTLTSKWYRPKTPNDLITLKIKFDENVIISQDIVLLDENAESLLKGEDTYYRMFQCSFIPFLESGFQSGSGSNPDKEYYLSCPYSVFIQMKYICCNSNEMYLKELVEGVYEYTITEEDIIDLSDGDNGGDGTK